MITISLQGLDGVQSVLAALAESRNAQRAANAAAESYTDDILNWIAEGRSFTPRHGGAGLEGAISWRPLGGGAVIFANKGYAQYVEEGTGVHAGRQGWVIRPKVGRKALKIPTGGPGGYVLRREVFHPGSKALPFFFADQAGREDRMGGAVRSVLLEEMARG